MNESIQVLEKAIEILETDGWCRKLMTDDKGHHCILGAMNKASFSLGLEEYEAEELVRQQLEKEGFGGSYLYYNDYVAKDKRYVIRLLQRTIRANS